MARYQLHAKFWPSLVMALILILFSQLSIWQWHRYHQKLHLQNTYQAALHTAAIPLTQALAQTPLPEPLFIAVRLQGHFDTAHSLVLDNRSQQGKPGYEILTPLLLADHQAILIDRGFVPVGQHWQSLPNLSVSTELVQLQGFLSRAPHTFSLGPAIEAASATWPLRIARIDFQVLKPRYAYPLLPYVILAKADQPGSFRCEWSYPQLFAERSLGYTFQWLALAIATLVLWVMISFKKKTA